MLLLQKIVQAADTAKMAVATEAHTGLTAWIADFATGFIGYAGYTGIMVLMMLESMVAPVPSEAVMPFAGFAIYEGTLTWPGVILFSTIGSIIGSLISYWIGAKGGRPLVEKWGKYLLLDKHDLDITEKWFNKKGDMTVFICRFIPVVRHVISIPAGMGRMNLMKFSIYTTLGACMWNTILTIAGYYLKENWDQIMKYSHIIDYVIVAVLVIILVYYGYKLYQNRKKSKNA
ncbi:MAG TPA: DedA family protein [Bacteroidales bacterium]|nr:DedA family protein [Bacteroidales bacterium]